MRLELNNGADTFNDFSTADFDKLLVDRDVFDFGVSITADEIVNQLSGTTVNTTIASEQFIYLQETNQLFFDSDGTGTASEAVLVATVNITGGVEQGLDPNDFYYVL